MKYEFTGETMVKFGVTFKRIRALRDIARWLVKAGDIGGWLQGNNLDQNGDAWVSGDAWVYGNAWVYGDARVYGNAQVYGNAWVYGDARVYGNAQVYGNARCLLTIGPLGSRAATLTVTADAKIGVRFSTGCFSGSRDEFLDAIESKHGDNEHGNAYAMAVALADVMIDPIGNERPRHLEQRR